MKIKDIARLAGVSTATVSRVINNSSLVKEETRKMVLEVIKAKNYKPNITAQNLARKETNTIGVVIPDLDNPFFGKIIKGIYEKIEEENLNIILLNSYGSLEKEKRVIEILIEQRVKGVIIVPVAKDKFSRDKHFNRLDEFKIPYVLIDREVEGDNFSKVYLENRTGAYKATKYLLTKVSDVAMISGPIRTTTATKRLEGYSLAMREKNLEEKIYYGDYKIESGYKIITQIIREKKLPKALFVANNMMTLGVIKGLIENDIKISENILIFSFDEVEMAEIFGIKIDYLEFDVKSVGEKAVDILKGKLNGDRSRKIVKISGKIKE
ncbi:LacI family DNA-binding transcriptional regulator [Psychrilyobacter sp.]|uniref:LacI family DNA-binding transcriptional regulator n=1 Tax=Psychrilyobacter sp. TaxID=2586924 RepID=UPI003019C45E